jgi:hypothetical protein
VRSVSFCIEKEKEQKKEKRREEGRGAKRA